MRCWGLRALLTLMPCLLAAEPTSHEQAVAAIRERGGQVTETVKDGKRQVTVTLGGAEFGDSDLPLLKGLVGLHVLKANSSRVTGAGLVHLKEHKELVRLYLTNRPVGDKGLAHLKIRRAAAWRRGSHKCRPGPSGKIEKSQAAETWIYIARIHRMSRFSLPDKNKDDDLLKRPPKRLQT